MKTIQKFNWLVGIAVLMTTVTVSHAEPEQVWQDKQGNVHQDTAWQQSKNNFGAMLLAINDVPAFEKAWYRPASPDYTPNIPTTNTAKVNETITLLTMFSGCKANAQGKCLLKGQLEVIDPENKRLHKQAVTFYDDKQPPAHILTVSPARLNFSIDDTEPTGNYKFAYTVTDAYANTTLHLEQKVLFSK